jgi:hypothetical protein
MWCTMNYERRYDDDAEGESKSLENAMNMREENQVKGTEI